MNKTVILMLYPSQGEVQQAYGEIFPYIKGVVSARKFDMVETETHRIHFRSAGGEVKFLQGYLFDKAYVHPAVNLYTMIDPHMSMHELVCSRIRDRKDPQNHVTVGTVTLSQLLEKK